MAGLPSFAMGLVLNLVSDKTVMFSTIASHCFKNFGLMHVGLHTYKSNIRIAIRRYSLDATYDLKIYII